MSVPYLVLDYKPWQTGDARPALLVSFERQQPLLFGLGVAPGCPFDVRPFAGAFPEDVAVAWVFAEWVEALRSELQVARTRESLLAWLSAIPEAPFSIIEASSAEPLENLVETFAAAPIQKRQVALAVLRYLLEEVCPEEFEIHRDHVISGAKRRAVLSLRTTDNDLVGQFWLTRTASEGQWHVMGAEPEASKPILLGDLEGTSLPQCLMTWLSSLPRSNCG